MTWILIVLTYVGGATSVTGFKSREDCEKASASVMTMQSFGFGTVKTVCVGQSK